MLQKYTFSNNKRKISFLNANLSLLYVLSDLLLKILYISWGKFFYLNELCAALNRLASSVYKDVLSQLSHLSCNVQLQLQTPNWNFKCYIMQFIAHAYICTIAFSSDIFWCFVKAWFQCILNDLSQVYSHAGLIHCVSLIHITPDIMTQCL